MRESVMNKCYCNFYFKWAQRAFILESFGSTQLLFVEKEFISALYETNI